MLVKNPNVQKKRVTVEGIAPTSTETSRTLPPKTRIHSREPERQLGRSRGQAVMTW